MKRVLIFVSQPNIYRASAGTQFEDALTEALRLAREKETEIGFFHQEVLVMVIADSDRAKVTEAWSEAKANTPGSTFAGMVRLHEPRSING